MKTDAEKRAFLKAEGWKIWKHRGRILCPDPVTGSTYGRAGIDAAVKLAIKRKAARERARLRKAGIVWVERVCGGYGYFNQNGGKGNFWFDTRQEAIAYLDRMDEHKEMSAYFDSIPEADPPLTLKTFEECMKRMEGKE